MSEKSCCLCRGELDGKCGRVDTLIKRLQGKSIPAVCYEMLQEKLKIKLEKLDGLICTYCTKRITYQHRAIIVKERRERRKEELQKKKESLKNNSLIVDSVSDSDCCEAEPLIIEPKTDSDSESDLHKPKPDSETVPVNQTSTVDNPQHNNELLQDLVFCQMTPPSTDCPKQTLQNTERSGQKNIRGEHVKANSTSIQTQTAYSQGRSILKTYEGIQRAEKKQASTGAHPYVLDYKCRNRYRNKSTQVAQNTRLVNILPKQPEPTKRPGQVMPQMHALMKLTNLKEVQDVVQAVQICNDVMQKIKNTQDAANHAAKAKENGDFNLSDDVVIVDHAPVSSESANNIRQMPLSEDSATEHKRQCLTLSSPPVVGVNKSNSVITDASVPKPPISIASSSAAISNPNQRYNLPCLAMPTKRSTVNSACINHTDTEPMSQSAPTESDIMKDHSQLVDFMELLNTVTEKQATLSSSIISAESKSFIPTTVIDITGDDSSSDEHATTDNNCTSLLDDIREASFEDDESLIFVNGGALNVESHDKSICYVEGADESESWDLKDDLQILL